MLHKALHKFKEQNGFEDPELFISFLSSMMTTADCADIAEETVCQAKCKKWHELRFGRITASKIHEAVHCQTLQGSLVEAILGARKFHQTGAMERGIQLEGSVLQEVEKTLRTKIRKCGLHLNSEWPIFGASPDGLNETHAFEVKCPISIKTFENYIKDGAIGTRYLYHISARREVAPASGIRAYPPYTRTCYARTEPVV
ncbi:hypothetical protein M8J75_005521 [Diaphorina citri]|nr:hypothetical protein M8J75_005521 [Diaphorina citri]